MSGHGNGKKYVSKNISALSVSLMATACHCDFKPKCRQRTERSIHLSSEIVLGNSPNNDLVRRGSKGRKLADKRAKTGFERNPEHSYIPQAYIIKSKIFDTHFYANRTGITLGLFSQPP